MNELMQSLQARLGPNAKAIRALMAPLVVVMILAMMVLPLPAFALDLLFTFNIAMALMVMMVAAYMNLKEIAAVLKVTESRVCQLHSQSIARLRVKLREY